LHFAGIAARGGAIHSARRETATHSAGDHAMLIEGRSQLVAMGNAVCLKSSGVATIFDLSHRFAMRRINALFGLYQIESTFRFSDIKGIGLKEFNNEGLSYLPVITLKNGRRKYLGIMNGSALTLGPLVDALCEATRLPRIDHRWTWWGW